MVANPDKIQVTFLGHPKSSNFYVKNNSAVFTSKDNVKLWESQRELQTIRVVFLESQRSEKVRKIFNIFCKDFLEAVSLLPHQCRAPML